MSQSLSGTVTAVVLDSPKKGWVELALAATGRTPDRLSVASDGFAPDTPVGATVSISIMDPTPPAGTAKP